MNSLLEKSIQNVLDREEKAMRYAVKAAIRKQCLDAVYNDCDVETITGHLDIPANNYNPFAKSNVHVR